VVSLKSSSPGRRKRFARKVGRFSSLARELLFSDGKVLADYSYFLRSNDPGLVTSLWLLSLARFGPRWSAGEQAACVKLVQGLSGSWAAYVHSPQGSSILKDLSEWRGLAVPLEEEEDQSPGTVSSGWSHTLDQAPEAPVGNIINEEHSGYVFTVSAMVGILVAALCHRICLNAVAFAMGRASFAELFERTFPRLSHARCLQHSCFTYRIPPEGSAYSPPTEPLTKGQLDVPYFLDDFCPELFAEARRLSGITDSQYFHSICRPDLEFVEFLASSKSGEFFLFSHDGRYLLKTARRSEAETLLKMLPDMLERFKSCPQSLLGRYLGLHRVYGDEVQYDVLFFVMQSVTQHAQPIHYRYDLKGCYGSHRKAKPGQSVRKDLDWFEDFGDLRLSEEDADALVLSYAEDVRLLRKHGITDYSILLEVHDREAAAGQASTGTGSTASTWSPQLATADSSGARKSWLPWRGLPGDSGRYLYTMALIDLLVAYGWRGRVEVGCHEVMSCGHGHTYSKLSPSDYADRQFAMLEKMCGRGSEDSGSEGGGTSNSSEA